ncbi:hypothetical protein GJ496_009463 [Pomphorhynchus laevis]|nr:hypothetical protein GJ496_009463 [Pomphorhynchus laevis]
MPLLQHVKGCVIILLHSDFENNNTLNADDSVRSTVLLNQERRLQSKVDEKSDWLFSYCVLRMRYFH